MPATRQATASWQSELTFSARVGSGHEITLDASPEHGGANRGASPTELLLAGLAGCTGMDVVAMLRKMRQQVTAYRVEVTGARRAEHPQIFTEIQVEHVLSGSGLDRRQVARAVELSASHYCPASAMLGALARVEHTFRIEAEEERVEGEGVTSSSPSPPPSALA